MNIRFKKIILNNFMSFEEAEVSLEDMGTVLISGENHNVLDNAISNGSGKSTIFNALCWAITGETAQGVRSNIENIYGNPGDCWVELEFSVDNNDIYIRRTKTPKPDMKVYVNGDDVSGKGVQESVEVLKQYIPEMDSKLLGSIIILGQGLPHRFTNQRPRFRKEFLENITNTDYMINSVRDTLQNRFEGLDFQLKELERIKTVDETKLEMLNKQVIGLNSQLLESESYDSEYKLEDRIVYLTDKISKLKSNEITLKNTILELNDKISSTTNNRSKFIISSKEIQESKCSAVNELIANLNIRIVENTTKINSLKKEISKLKNVTDICPTCGQKIPGAHVVDTSSKEDELNILLNTQDELEKELSINNNEKSNIIRVLDSEFSESILEFDNQIGESKVSLKSLNSDLDQLQERIQRNVKEQAKVQNMKDNYDKIKLNISNINEEICEITDKLDICISDILKVNNHLNVVKDLLKIATGEFRNALLKNVIQYIENKMKEYSRKVFGSDKLTFKLEGNDINMMYCDKPYDNLSGGEKQKFDIIIQLALRELLSKQLGIRSNLLVIDEVFDNLDSVGCHNVIDLISQLNDIESIFIITHHKETLQITNDSEIVVQKGQNGVSTLTLV